MTQQEVQAIVMLGAAVGLVAVAQRIVRAQGPALGLSPGMAQLVMTMGATVVAKTIR